MPEIVKDCKEKWRKARAHETLPLVTFTDIYKQHQKRNQGTVTHDTSVATNDNMKDVHGIVSVPCSL